MLEKSGTVDDVFSGWVPPHQRRKDAAERTTRGAAVVITPNAPTFKSEGDTSTSKAIFRLDKGRVHDNISGVYQADEGQHLPLPGAISKDARTRVRTCCGGDSFVDAR